MAAVSEFAPSFSEFRKIVDEAETVEVSARGLRAYFDGDTLPDNLETALDSAQGNINPEGSPTYVVIRVRP